MSKAVLYLKRIVLPSVIFLSAIYFSVLIETGFFESFGISKYIQPLNSLLYSIAISWWIIIGIKVIKKLLLKKYNIDESDNLKSRKVLTQFNILQNVIIFMVVLFAIGAVLMSIDGIKRIGISIFASAGIAGLIIGLAAQKAIGAVLAGIQIAITQPIRIDDVVIAEKEWGWIEEITLTYVVVRIWDQRRLILPSTYFIENPFQNWTRVSADILGTVFLYTDYKVPFNALREETTRLLNETSLWDGRVNVLQVTDAKENTVEVRVLVSAKDSPTAWDLRVYLREKLIEFIQKKYPESLPRTRINITELNKQN